MGLFLRAALISAIFMLLVFLLATYAGAQGLRPVRPEPDDLGPWIRSLMMPDRPYTSCCGPADAYYAGDLKVVDGKTYVTVLAPLRPQNPVPVGTIVEVPPAKFNRDANITGSLVIFLSTNAVVYCFISGSGV